MLALGNRIIVKREAPVEEKKLIITNTVKPLPPVGEVISVGPKVEDVRIGDKVQFNANYSAKLLESDDKVEYLVLNQDNILCKY